MKKVGALYYPDHESKFTQFGDAILDVGSEDRAAAYKYVRNWTRALDVGANAGIFACAFAGRFKEVVAFEPMPLTRECLLANVPSNVRVEGCAVSDREGVLRMYRAGGSGGSFVLNHPDVVVPDGALKANREVEVPARTIDSFDFSPVDLIKLDIQGSEFAALIGARNTILRNRPVISIEEKAYSDDHARYIDKASDLLVSYGMTAKEKVRTDRIYVFED